VIPPGPPATALADLLWSTGESLVLPLNREAALYQAAQRNGLGERLTNEYEVMHNGQNYIAQIFEAGLVYVPAGQWDQVEVLERTQGLDEATRMVSFAVAGGDSQTIFWDDHITGFHGNRGQYWDWYLEGQVPGLTRIMFKDDVVAYNPVLQDDGWVFKPDKVYRMPRGLGQAASPDSHPAVHPANPSPQPPPRPVPPGGGVPPPPEFVQVVNQQFYINGQPERFIGTNIRGLVHYGYINRFPGNPIELRRQQLQAAREMNVRLVRVFLPHRETATEGVIARLQETIDLLRNEFPEMYLIPALTDLYIDAEFFVRGDDHFYETQTAGGKQILNHAFYSGGYKDNYAPFVKAVVERFRDEPRIFAWEIGNELKAEKTSELDDHQTAQLLVTFMTTMAGQIKSWDANHMVTTGMISTRHAFMDKFSPLRDELYGSAQIDFVTIHPYNGNKRIPPNQGSPAIEEENDMDMARKHRKPLIVEAAGFHGHHFTDRPASTREDMAHWFGEGASGYMLWAFQRPDIGDGDSEIGMTGPDFDQLYRLQKQAGEILRDPAIKSNNEALKRAMAGIDYQAQDLTPGVIWPIIADGFDFPVGKPDAQAYYVASGLVDPDYYTELGFWHTGEDWNGRGGGDTDLGDPVFAIAHGLVITSQHFSTWGNIVLLEHQLPAGQKVWSQYAHLSELFVKKGDVVRRGDALGTIGKGDGNRYLAHLHFEIRLHDLPASKWGWKTAEDREAVLRHYAHPTNFINNYRPQ